MLRLEQSRESNPNACKMDQTSSTHMPAHDNREHVFIFISIQVPSFLSLTVQNKVQLQKKITFTLEQILVRVVANPE